MKNILLHLTGFNIYKGKHINTELSLLLMLTFVVSTGIQGIHYNTKTQLSWLLMLTFGVSTGIQVIN